MIQVLDANELRQIFNRQKETKRNEQKQNERETEEEEDEGVIEANHESLKNTTHVTEAREGCYR